METRQLECATGPHTQCNFRPMPPLNPHPKVHHGFGNTLVRGIFANWLVGVAVWQANAAQDLTGKFVAIW